MWRRLITPAVRVGSKRRNRILLYHRVVDDGAAALPEASITCGAFAAQLDYLARHHEVVPLEALLEGRGNRRNLVAITFDDAFEDNLRNAWPLLRERGMPATVFAVSDYVGGERRFPWAPDVRTLTADDLRTLEREGMRVEAHTADETKVTIRAKLAGDGVTEIKIRVGAGFGDEMLSLDILDRIKVKLKD